LRELLRECTARVASDGGGGQGAGFFVDEHHLLTCWHVVGRKGPCTVWPEQRQQRSGNVICGDEELDIALIEVEEVPGEPLQPTVVIRSEFSDGDVVVSGYPDLEVAGPGHQNRPYKGIAHTDQGRLTAIRLAGENVTYGQSGGAVLDLTTGAVVAIARWTDAPEGLSGGSIPIAIAEEWFTSRDLTILRDVQRRPLPSTARWRDTLGHLPWTSLGYRMDMWEVGASLDIHVASIDGQRGCWQVLMGTAAGSPSRLTIHDLGDDVAEVLFHWAHRGRVHTEDEVDLFGRLLSSALFPQSVRQRLATVRSANPALVRLVMGDDALASVPWELAAAPGGSDFLAADEKLRFCRVAADAPELAYRPESTLAQIVGIVVQHENLHEQAPVVVHDRKSEPWPHVNELVGGLERCFDTPSYQYQLLKNPSPDQVEDRLEHPSDVVHYIGFGRIEKSRVELAFADDDGNIDFHPASKLFEWVARAQARLLVIELATPPPDLDLDPVSSGSFADALGGSLGAVIFTSVPVHPLLYQPFNRKLYEVLAAGRTVEEAVQMSRKKLHTNVPLDDHAAFGWFTLITGREAGIRIVAAQAGERSAAGQRSLTPVGSDASASAEGQRTPSDEFRQGGP
jgi:Trypsin-like peptidase domain/CHAT domain